MSQNAISSMQKYDENKVFQNWYSVITDLLQQSGKSRKSEKLATLGKIREIIKLERR